MEKTKDTRQDTMTWKLDTKQNHEQPNAKTRNRNLQS